jgi:hypothetical protein
MYLYVMAENKSMDSGKMYRSSIYRGAALPTLVESSSLPSMAGEGNRGAKRWTEN